MDADRFHAHVADQFAEYVNPYLGKLMNFAGFGVEMRAEGCTIWDHEGREYLDCLGGYGVFSVGHRHPHVVAAVKDQLDTMPLSSKVFFGAVATELAERLARISPGNLQFTFFSNSGTEAVEAALKFAKGATGRSKIVSTHGGYHGKTLGALATTGRSKYQDMFRPLMPGPVFVEYGDAAEMEQAVDDETAAVIIETIQGEGGIHVAPQGYLTKIREACDRHGALMIADEVQTGLGRCGYMFGCEKERVAPDLMCLAKALGGGVMPIGATLGTKAVWDAVYGKNPLMHTSTFGGNPLACRAALATLDVIEREGLVERSRERGAQLMSGLKEVQARYSDLIHEVRGEGLMIGVEFTQDEVGELTVAQMTKRGLIAAYTLNNARVIRFEPPLIITAEQVDFAVRIFGEALAETADLLASLV